MLMGKKKWCMGKKMMHVKKNDWIQCTNRGVGFTWTTYTTVEEKQIGINDKLVDVIRIW